MKTMRLLVTGYSVPQRSRHVAYALELGATVLHVGYEALYGENPPAAYRFELVGENASPAIRLNPRRNAENSAEYDALIEQESQRLAALAADFAPDLCHAIGMDLTLPLCVHAGLRPLLVSALGFLNHWVYGEAKPNQSKLKEYDHLLFAADGLLVEPPMMVEVSRGLLPPTVRVMEFAIGLDGRQFRPAEPSARAAWRRALQLPPEATVLLSPRGWGPPYHHDLVLEAFAKALPTLPAPAYLLFTRMGRSGNSLISSKYVEQVRQRAEELGITEHIRWLPSFPAATIATLYNAADLVISATVPDAFPATVLEALACGRPVIVPNLPTFADSVLAQHCHLVPPENSDALAAIMVELAHNPPTAQALDAARQAVLARYDKPVVMQQIEAIYDSLIASKYSVK